MRSGRELRAVVAMAVLSVAIGAPSARAQMVNWTDARGQLWDIETSGRIMDGTNETLLIKAAALL